jgi:hypothetical protein
LRRFNSRFLSEPIRAMPAAAAAAIAPFKMISLSKNEQAIFEVIVGLLWFIHGPKLKLKNK